MSAQLARYTKLNFATHTSVVDERTGLEWAVNVPSLQGKRFEHAEAEKVVKALNDSNYLGHNDWRMPTMHELFGLVRSDIANAVYDADAFPDMRTDDWYWASDIYPRNTSYAFAVHFDYGYVDDLGRSIKRFVRPVRVPRQ
jgi:hypothetical protein